MSTRSDLLKLCKEKGLKGYSGLKKDQLLHLLAPIHIPVATPEVPSPSPSPSPPPKVQRLNYIGSKFQLLEWITTAIQEKTGWTDFSGKRIADLFAGTGIVSYHFRQRGSVVISNDAELYSSVITHAFTCSTYNPTVTALITQLNHEITEEKHHNPTHAPGTITERYSPYNTNLRMFFTVENAQRIDYLRGRLEELQPTVSVDDHKFLLASLLLSADAVSNVPAVYGCYLKNFKEKAKKTLTLTPIHTNTADATEGSTTYHSDVLADQLLQGVQADAVYLDPPYNERQYSKNYFPLNIIALPPSAPVPMTRGVTGIPDGCFMSPFCKKGAPVTQAFEKLFQTLQTEWVFLSYNSESLIPKDTMMGLMEKYGTASVIERDYKRFKSFEYNEDKQIKEYLFCLKKTPTSV